MKIVCFSKEQFKWNSVHIKLRELVQIEIGNKMCYRSTFKKIFRMQWFFSLYSYYRCLIQHLNLKKKIQKKKSWPLSDLMWFYLASLWTLLPRKPLVPSWENSRFSSNFCWMYSANIIKFLLSAQHWGGTGNTEENITDSVFHRTH